MERSEGESYGERVVCFMSIFIYSYDDRLGDGNGVFKERGIKKR